MSSHEPGCWCWSDPVKCHVHRPRAVKLRHKRFVAYGPGFSGDYESYAEAETCVSKNGAGAVYELCDQIVADRDRLRAALEQIRAAIGRLTFGDNTTDAEKLAYSYAVLDCIAAIEAALSDTGRAPEAP